MITLMIRSHATCDLLELDFFWATSSLLLTAFHLSNFKRVFEIIKFDVWVFTVVLELYIPCCISLSSFILTLSDKKRIDIIYDFVATSSAFIIVMEFGLDCYNDQSSQISDIWRRNCCWFIK